MKRVFLNKIASVTRSCRLEREVWVGGEIPAREGAVVAVEVLTDKTTYNQLELPSGRLSFLRRGDVLAGALGHRHALFGYSGELPDRLAPGDTIQLLNQGGVLGRVTSINPDLGPPFDCRVLGAVLSFPHLGERVGVPAVVGEGLPTAEPLSAEGARLPPVVALVGSCMNCGKTAAACSLIGQLTHAGLTVDAFKATGVSLRRDVLAMEDAGARHTGIFTDLGIVSTGPESAPAVVRSLVARLAAGAPDLIVVELGDGLLGAYGVEAILDAPDLRAALTAVVLVANDPVAAWGGVRLLREQHGIEPAAVTGPATDNAVGVGLIGDRLKVPAINARTDGDRLARAVLDHLERCTGRPLVKAAAGDPAGDSGDEAGDGP